MDHLRTILFREEHDLNRADVEQPIEAARCRSFWPFAFTDKALDGSPVEFCRLSRLSIRSILATFPEDEVVDFFALWCEHTLRLLGEVGPQDLLGNACSAALSADAA